MAALSFACKSIRYTGSMWISIWESEGQQFVQALAWCGLQGLGCSRISAVRLVQQHWEERWLAVILCWKIPWSRFLGFLLLMVNTNSDFPVKGDKMLAKYADKSYAKVFMHNTIGLSGTSVLWIFGRLYAAVCVRVWSCKWPLIDTHIASR